MSRCPRSSLDDPDVVPRLEQAGYDQEPQVEGKSASKRRRLFT